MSVRIITDSASDILQGTYPEVIILPMTVTIDGEVFLDGIDITKDEFYAKLESSEIIPASSLINASQFEEVFRIVKASGDEAIVLPISSGLSGTYQSAMIAAEEYSCISVVDTGLVSAAEAILVQRAVELVREGRSREEIVQILEDEKNDVIIYVVADTLKYLKKGGRISRGAALIGTVMNIKPILTLEDKKMISIGKVRGSRKGMEFMNEQVGSWGGIDFSRPYAVGYAGTERSKLYEYIESNRELSALDSEEIQVIQIGSAVGTHCGPGAVSITFFKKR